MMKRSLCVLTTVLLLISACVPGFADSTPLIYRVSDDEGHCLYVMGTIHLGKPDMYPIAGIDAILDQCDTLALEVTDEEDQTTARSFWAGEQQEESVPDMITGLPELMMFLFDSVTLSGNGLTDAELTQIADILELEDGELILKWLKPSALCDFLCASFYGKAGMDIGYSTEYYLTALALDRGMEIIGLETDESQMEMLAFLSEDNYLAMLREELNDPESLICEVTESADAWTEGNRERMRENEEPEEPTEDTEAARNLAEFEVKLDDERNIAFAGKIREFLAEGRHVLVAVGYSHLVDRGGIRELLLADGYHLEAVSGTD